MCRLGSVVVNGTIHNASITASGVSTVWINGLDTYATVNLAGTADVYISSNSGTLIVALHIRTACAIGLSLIQLFEHGPPNRQVP